MRKPQISERAKRLPESPIRGLYPYAKLVPERIEFNTGDPRDIPLPPVILGALERGILIDEDLHYASSPGLGELREAIAGFFHSPLTSLDADDVVISQGGSEAIPWAFFITADYGEKVAVPEPFYSSYGLFAKEMGVELIPIYADPESGYHLNKVHIQALHERGVRAILLNSPNNPTGVTYTGEELQWILDEAEEHGLWVISDEVYRKVVFDGKGCMGMYDVSKSENLIVLYSASKGSGVPGWRLGSLMSVNKDAAGAALKLAQGRISATSTHLQRLWAQVLNSNFDGHLLKLAAEFQKRRDLIYESLKSVEGVQVALPEGALYLMADIGVDGHLFAKFLLEHRLIDVAHAWVAPGKEFFITPSQGSKKVRFAFAPNQVKTTEGINGVITALRSFRETVR